MLVDTTSIFAIQQYLKEHDFPVQGNPNYAGLVAALESEFPDENFEPKISFLAVDFQNENQKKFSGFMQNQLGFIVDATDYRDAFIMPDRSSPYQRLSTRITYLAGLFASKRLHLVVVSDAFEIYYPLLDIVQNRGGKVSLAFFRSGMEPRFQRAGLFSADSPIQFIDLDPHAKKIIGVDLEHSSSWCSVCRMALVGYASADGLANGIPSAEADPTKDATSSWEPL